MKRCLSWVVPALLIVSGASLFVLAPPLSRWIEPRLVMQPREAEGASGQGTSEGAKPVDAPKPSDAAIAELRSEIHALRSWVVAQALNMLGVVLAVIGMLLALISLAGTAWARGFIDRTVKQDLAKTRLELISREEMRSAVDTYTENIDQAIIDTKRALESGVLLPDYVVVGKTNLAYFYAYRRDPADAAEAQRLAREAVDEGDQGRRHRLMQLRINQGYVRLRFAADAGTIEAAKQFLQILKNHPDCTALEQGEIDGYLA